MYSLGYNSFWSFGSPAVQELLTKSDLKLDELLDEDGLILEVKNHNQNLYDFILKEDNFKELISCAISEPDVEKLEHNQKKCFKYPFTSADILSSDSQPIVSEFFKSTKDLKENSHKAEIHHDDDDEVNVDSVENTDDDTVEKPVKATSEILTKEEEKEDEPESLEYPYLDHLFSFFDSEVLNLTSAGYFAKIVNNLLNKKPSELISYIYEKKPEILKRMIHHISSKSIAEFLAKVLTFESSIVPNVNNNVYNEKRIEVLQEIIKKLQPESDLEEINNTAYLICEVFGKYNSMHCSHEILQNLLERPVIDYFFDILKTGKSTSSCAVALILGNIFAYYILLNSSKAEMNFDNPFGESDSQASKNQPFQLNSDIPLVAAFIESLGQIIKYIGNSSGEGIPGQHGTLAQPFGSARLKVLELIIIAMKTNNQEIYDKLIEENFFETLLEVFVKHDWNNMLHNQIEKILTHIIEGSSEELRKALFGQAKILDFIIDASKESEFILNGKHGRKVRKGYLGQLIRLSNKILESREPVIQNEIENNEQWKEYVNTQLAEANQREKVNFGGKDPRAPVPDDDIILENPNWMQKFSKLLNIGGRGSQQKEEEKEEEEEVEEEEEREEEEQEEYMENFAEEEDFHQNSQTGVVTSDEFISETEKNVLEVTSPEAHEEERTKQATVPVRGRHSFDPLTRFIPDYDEEVKEENENKWILEAASLKTVEEKLDPKYFNNVFWRREELYSPDDILKEFEGI